MAQPGGKQQVNDKACGTLKRTCRLFVVPESWVLVRAYRTKPVKSVPFMSSVNSVSC